MLKKKNLSPGFSIIEILISLTLIAVLSGIGLLSYTQVNTKQRLQKAATLTKATLKQAQQEAFLGKKPNDSGCNTFTGTRVTFDLSANPPSLITTFVCDVTRTFNTRTMTYDKGISLTLPAPLQPVEFATISRKTNLSSDFIFTVAVSASQYQVIRITPTGMIQ